MKILVAYASKHGSTREIAQYIAATLREQGHEATAMNMKRVMNLGEYDAYVLGSAVYMGNWLKLARRFVIHQSYVLQQRPVWIFSSGPLGDPPKPSTATAVNVEDIMRCTKARSHRVFCGKLDKSKLSFTERTIVRALKAPEGDFRDWPEIAAWAIFIAHYSRDHAHSTLT